MHVVLNDFHEQKQSLSDLVTLIVNYDLTSYYSKLIHLLIDPANTLALVVIVASLNETSLFGKTIYKHARLEHVRIVMPNRMILIPFIFHKILLRFSD